MENEEDVEQASLNFIPCVAWIRRGVAKLNPEKVWDLPKLHMVDLINVFNSISQVELTKEELEALIGKTKGDLAELDEEDKEDDEEDKTMEEGDESAVKDDDESGEEAVKEMDEDAKIAAEYGLDDYDDGWLI